jgi:hypothetical protein
MGTGFSPLRMFLLLMVYLKIRNIKKLKTKTGKRPKHNPIIENAASSRAFFTLATASFWLFAFIASFHIEQAGLCLFTLFFCRWHAGEKNTFFLLKSSLPRRTRGTFSEHSKSKKKRKEDAEHFLRVAMGFWNDDNKK